MEKRPRGRPRKLKDSIKPWEFGRFAKASCAYDEFRELGEKHDGAVKEVVATLKQSSPEIPISETGVKRILSKYRPKGSGTILRFERSTLSEEDRKKYRSVLEQATEFCEKMGLPLPQLPVFDETRHREKFLIRFSERPDYPRHNRKAPKE